MLIFVFYMQKLCLKFFGKYHFTLDECFFLVLYYSREVIRGRNEKGKRRERQDCCVAGAKK